MRVAFTGKGGSGKSTAGCLFIEYLRIQDQRVLVVDADINVHMASLLGMNIEDRLALSAPYNVETIRRHLLGTNQLIGSVERFVKTTPPGPGSKWFTLADDDVVASRFSVHGNDLRLMHVGTYEAEDIGTSCYHVNLAILENLLSHSQTNEDEWIVCDMVAGTDAFSNSLHAQFEAIVVVVEPTPESVGVARKYRELANAAGTLDTLVLIGNKVADQHDIEYLERETGGSVLATIGLQPGLRRARQVGRRPNLEDAGDDVAFKAIEQFARTSPHSPARRKETLHALHRKLAQEAWVQRAHGDLTHQIPSA